VLSLRMGHIALGPFSLLVVGTLTKVSGPAFLLPLLPVFPFPPISNPP
jgi:hypothetical protein